ncbi:PAS domain S-box protein [Halorussus halophilus]|uniref:PAS domain S-box protein n=1 Tax=Halorussus halophilus TaxID=2650975 RepID=UPI001787DFA2|nr:PAS domain S-box protein [Halorussus halophilus]
MPLVKPLLDRTSGEVLIISILVGGPGLALVYAGYRLPQMDIRPELYSRMARWCLGGIGVMLAIILFVKLAAGLNDELANFLILPALGSLAGLGMGYHDAKARTRARNAEEKQREAERYSHELERYERIVETVNDGIFVVNEDDVFTLVNEAYTKLVGYDREAILDSNISLVLEEAAKSTDEIQHELLTEDSNVGTTEDSDVGTYEGTLKSASGERIEVEATFALLPAEQGDSYDRVGVVRDVSERNEREQRLERQNERLDSFASMLAHELRNPTAIGQIYAKQLPEEASPEAVEYVTEAFDRIEDMVDVMLVVARGHEAVSTGTTVQLADASQAAWEEVDAPDATLELELDGEIEADETYIQHLFRNLFENSVEHGSESVTITVGELPTGFYVADDGTGISSEHRNAVFEPGFTTAAGQGGTGLGLAFVRELTEVYEWTCTVTESTSGGARFEFRDVATMQELPE